MNAETPVEQPIYDAIDNAWAHASIWGKIGMVLGTLLGIVLLFSCIWSWTAARAARDMAVSRAREELRQSIGMEVDVFGNPPPARFRVEKNSPWDEPVRGTLVVLLPEGAEDFQILPALEVSDTDSGLFGLTDFELALSKCSFSVNYNVDGVQRARVWNGCPTLKEGIEIDVREIEARVGEDEHAWSQPTRSTKEYDLFEVFGLLVGLLIDQPEESGK